MPKSSSASAKHAGHPPSVTWPTPGTPPDIPQTIDRAANRAAPPPGDDVKEVVATLMRSLVGPDVSPPDFLRRAEALKRALAAPMTGAAPETATTASLALQEDDGFRGVHPKVEAAIRVLHTAVALHRPVSEEDVAREVRLHAAHLGRLLKCYTGHGFREWRRALQMREAVMLLVHTHEHVDQIAYCRLAYDHAAQFSRDFRRTFGVSPRCFRQLYAAAERLARVAARKATV